MSYESALLEVERDNNFDLAEENKDLKIQLSNMQEDIEYYKEELSKAKRDLTAMKYHFNTMMDIIKTHKKMNEGCIKENAKQVKEIEEKKDDSPEIYTSNEISKNSKIFFNQGLKMMNRNFKKMIIDSQRRMKDVH